MDLKGFQEYKPGSSRYNGRISEDEWNRHKPTLRKLHDAKLTRQQILDIISKDFGDTKPTYGQLCTKFDKWGFHVYRQGDRQKGNNAGKDGKKGKGANKNADAVATNADALEEIKRSRAFSPESTSDGSSTIIPDVGDLNINDRATPTALTDIPETPEAQHYHAPAWQQASPRTDFNRMVMSENSMMTSDNNSSSPANMNYYTPESSQNGHHHHFLHFGGHSDGGQAQRWISGTSSTTTAISHGHSSSTASDTVYATPASQPHREVMAQGLDFVEPDDPITIAARTEKADSAVDAVVSWWNSLGQRHLLGNHIITMTNMAAYLFATRSYAAAFRIYRKIYEIMSEDPECDDVSKIGALMRCCQCATDTSDLDFMQRELHQTLSWDLSDSALRAFSASMLQSVETQISEGFNLTQGSVLATTPIMRNSTVLATKGCSSQYPGTRRLYWRLRLMTHTPFHSGCTRLLKLMSEALCWAWAAMTCVEFDTPALTKSGCLCKDGLYFDFVRMVTMALLQAAVGFELTELMKVRQINQTPCACVMCADLATTFEICPIETLTSIAFLTVDRCRLDWTSCHPGGRHQELTPNAILKEQLLPTIETLLVQASADIQNPSNIHTSDLYDDFLSCLWLSFETHDLALRNARFDPSAEKINLILTSLVTEELNKSHPAQKSMSADGANGSSSTLDANGLMPVFTYAPEDTADLNDRITAKRTRSNASSLKPTSSNASERSMIRIRKKLKYRTSADYLNSMSSYSSLSSRNSMNRFSYVTGLPELEAVMDGDYDELGRELPPDLTPDEFRTMQGHYSWVPSRPGSTVNRTMSWRESYASGGGGHEGRGYSYRDSAGMSSRPGSQVNRRISGRDSQQPQTGSLQRRPSLKDVTGQGYGQGQGQDQYQNQSNNNHHRTTQDQQYQTSNLGQMNPPHHHAAQPPQSTTSIPPSTSTSGNTMTISNPIPASTPSSQPSQIQPPNPPPTLAQPQPPHQFAFPMIPVRRDSTKTTHSVKTVASNSSAGKSVSGSGSGSGGNGSGRGRWSAEHERVEKILRAVP